MNNSWFPLLCLYVESGYEFVAYCPEQLPNGEAFRVIKTNYKHKV